MLSSAGGTAPGTCPEAQIPGKCWSLHSVVLYPRHGEGDGSIPRYLSYIKKISMTKRQSKATTENTHRTYPTPLSLPDDPTPTSAETQSPICHPLSCQGLPHRQDGAVAVQDGGFQGAGPRGSVAGAGREAKQGQRSDCNFPLQRRGKEPSGQGETLIVLSQPGSSLPVRHQPLRGAADVWCKSAMGQKHPEGRRCTDRDGEMEEIAFFPRRVGRKGFSSALWMQEMQGLRAINRSGLFHGCWR